MYIRSTLTMKSEDIMRVGRKAKGVRCERGMNDKTKGKG